MRYTLLPASTRSCGELNSDASGYGADEVIGGRAWADGLRVKLENDAGMVANALVYCSERRLIRDRKREVVQADIGLAIKGDRAVRVGDAPDGEGYGSIGDEHGRVSFIPGDFLEAESPAEKAGGLIEVANGKTDMVHAVRQSIGQSFVLSSLQLEVAEVGKSPTDKSRSAG